MLQKCSVGKGSSVHVDGVITVALGADAATHHVKLLHFVTEGTWFLTNISILPFEPDKSGTAVL